MRVHRMVPFALVVSVAALLSACSSSGPASTAASTTTVVAATSSIAPAPPSTTPTSGGTTSATTTTAGATASSAPETTTPPTTTPPTTIAGAPAATTPQAAALGLHAAYKAGDRTRAAMFADPAAIATVFRAPYSGPDETFQGCEPEGAAFLCSFSYEGGAQDFHVSGNATAGYRVTTVTEIAD